MPGKPLPRQQRAAMHYIARHQTPDYGAIVLHSVAQGLMRRGLAVEASRRPYARATGVCLRLTETGVAFVKEYE